MSGVRRRVLNVLIVVVFAGVAYAPRLVTVSHLAPGRDDTTRSHLPVSRTSLSSAGDDEDPLADDPPDAVDLYGNEVTDAVAKYKLDASGMLYELHSPQTEVPRLRPPKT